MSRKKGIVAAVVIVLTCSCLVLGLRFYFFYKVRNTLTEKFESLNKSGYKVTYDSIDVDWKKGTLYLTNFVIRKNALDTICLHPEFFAARAIRADGLNFLDAIFQHEV